MAIWLLNRELPAATLFFCTAAIFKASFAENAPTLASLRSITETVLHTHIVTVAMAYGIFSDSAKVIPRSSWPEASPN